MVFEGKKHFVSLTYIKIQSKDWQKEKVSSLVYAVMSEAGNIWR